MAMRHNLIGLHKNTSLNFANEGLYIEVSLNIQENMVPFLTDLYKISKGNKYYVCFNGALIPNSLITQSEIYKTHARLLHDLQINCKRAKAKVLLAEIRNMRETTSW